jgi:hypothetical protein
MSEGIKLLAEEIMQQIHEGAEQSDIEQLLCDGVTYNARENNCNIPHVVRCADERNYTTMREVILAEGNFKQDSGNWRHWKYGMKTTIEAFKIALNS